MILKEAERSALTGDRIIRIASSWSFVDGESSVYELLSEIKEPYQHAIAVAGEGLKVLGMIVPQDLVEILGKPFGRDLLKRQNVEDIMRPAATFRYDEYIQEIRERVSGDIESDENSHFILVDENGAFRAHVTSQDIVMHVLLDYQRELDTAIAIQSRLVPPSLRIMNRRISITCSSVMAQGVGGDYYYVKEYAPGKWFFCLCDISGKGMSAAIITAVLAGFMYNADFVLPLENTVKSLNSIILETFKLKKYLTGIFMRFSEATGELEYCDMGHSYLFVIAGSSVQQLADTSDNVPVGLVADLSPTVKTLRLEPGTVLVLLSDGMIEQENRTGQTFRIDEIGRIFGECRKRDEDPIRAKIRIFETFFDFKKEMPQHDDVSMMIFHYRNT